MPDPTLPTPDVDIDVDSLSAAIAATPPPGAPPVEQPAAAPAADAKPADKPADKPAEPAKPADAKPKKGLDALGEEKVEEDKKEKKEEPAAATEPEVDTSKWQKPQAEAFAAMRGAKKRAEEQAKEAQKQLETLKKEFEEFKKTPRDSEATQKRLAELETWHKAQELTNTPEWDNTVTKPIQKSLDMLERIAKHAKVDYDTLVKATDGEVEFERILAIRKVFEGAEEPVPPELVSAAVSEAAKLHPLYEKAAEMKRQAGETLSSLQHQTAQQKEAEAKQAEAEYAKHHDHIYDQMAKKMPSLFADEAVAKEVKAARLGTDPADRAFAAQSAELLPVVWKKYLALKEDFTKERAAKLALLGTRPEVKPSGNGAKPVNADDTELDEAGLSAALRGR